MNDKTFSIGAIAVLFAFIALGIASLGIGGRTELDTFLRRTRGDRLDIPLTPAQASYTLEARRDGKTVPMSIADVKGRVIFLNFWGTFCPPCIEELPSLLAMARAHEDQGLVVLAVSYDDSWEAIDAFFKDFTSDSIPSNFLVVRDPERTADRDLKSAFGTKKIPESYLLRDGMTVARYVNARDWLDPSFVGVLTALQKR
ncbi:MAG: TlpA family protein disulfide reductase [Deltaproteobacteria bacterium]|nr:TlpA family protein disulfide reductase [Deltaproteobacteria bacterium]